MTPDTFVLLNCWSQKRKRHDAAQATVRENKFNAPLNAWELDVIPSMEGVADLYFASSISRIYLICENLRHLRTNKPSADDADFRRRREHRVDLSSKQQVLLKLGE